jgi:hypothetical protein
MPLRPCFLKSAALDPMNIVIRSKAEGGVLELIFVKKW